MYRLEELAEATGVSPRNIRYYTAQGLLPAPDVRGRFALYTEGYVRRLQIIQRLKDAFLPLEMIRAQLSHLTDAQISEMLTEQVQTLSENTAIPQKEKAASPPTDSAADYISRVLAKRSAPPPPAMAPCPAPVPAVPSETWERITLASGVELHVRHRNQFVQDIIAYAQSLRSPDR